MTEIRKMKIKEFIVFVLLIVCIISVYKLYTRPVGVYNVIYNGFIESVDVYRISNESGSRDEFSLDKKQDIEEFINLLNRYKYSKIPRFYIDGLYPVNTYDVIDFRILYSSNKVSHQSIVVLSNNEVSISYGKGRYRDYKVKGNERKLFEELLHWANKFD